MNKGKITRVSGPLVEAKGLSDANIYDVVEVSKDKLIGEIIEMRVMLKIFKFTKKQLELDLEMK